MAASSAIQSRMTGLRGRVGECQRLDDLIEPVRRGESRVLVILGEPGVGKTALLDHLLESAAGLETLRVAGVQSEMELAFAGAHQLLAPILDRVGRLPAPQRNALETAFGLASGPAPELFLVGLAALSLIAEAAAARPLICVVDDQQWLDRASSQVLAFVARRLQAESVALVFATRASDGDLAGLPELAVEGLREHHARALLDSVLTWPVDGRIRNQIVIEARGNPLALLELAQWLQPARLAGGFGLPGALSPELAIEESLRRRLGQLAPETRRIVLLAAADPFGDPTLIWRAGRSLGIPLEAAAAAADAGLLEFGARVRFCHPLARSAAYQSAGFEELRVAHGALAEALDPELDPERRAWHLAHAREAPDEEVAAELERSAERAKARGGLAAAAAFLEHAARLTPEPSLRVDRTLAAAAAKHRAAGLDSALGLLAVIDAQPLDRLQRARAELLRGQIAFASTQASDAPGLLLNAAAQFGELDPAMSRRTYLEAISAALFVGRLKRDVGVAEVAAAAREAPPAARSPGAADLLLEGIRVLITDGYAAGVAMVQRSLRAFAEGDRPGDDIHHWLFLACRCAHDVWDDETWYTLCTRQVAWAREAGALSVLPLALNQWIGARLHAGEFVAAAALVEELEALTQATGSDLPPYGAMALAGWQGHVSAADTLIETTVRNVVSRGQGMGLSLAHYTSAVLDNGLGEWDAARTAAELAAAYPEELGFANLGLVELIEAAARVGDYEGAAGALERLSETTRHGGMPWGLGVEARSRALLSVGEAADGQYREAIYQLGRCRGRMALARAHLVYGEWLRRERRKTDARVQLRTAHEMFLAIGAEAFAERSRRELLAAGETMRRYTPGTREVLTPQEAQIARLASNGLSNPEIGRRLYISPRTVQYHLSKVFTKLGVGSRYELAGVLSEVASARVPGATN